MRHQPITDATPRLDVHMSWWGMTHLQFNGREPDTEERFRLIAEAGFDGIDAFIPEPGEPAEQWLALMDRYGLSLSVNVYPTSLEELRRELERAATFGRIRYVNVQVLTPFLAGRAAAELLAGMADAAREYDFPLGIETHRGTITQDLLRTAEYVEQIPQLRLTADLSHYVLAGEMLRSSPEAERLFALLLARADCIHGRISNGQQIQVDAGADGSHPLLERYSGWWEQAMRSWLQAHPSGGGLLFIPELGPPPYAITTDEAAGRTQEFSDRWTQSLLLQQIARRLWDGLR